MTLETIFLPDYLQISPFFWDYGDYPLLPSLWRLSFGTIIMATILWYHHYGVFISQLVSLTCILYNVSDLSDRILLLIEQHLHNGYRFHKLFKTFTQFYHSNKDLVHITM